MMPYVVCLISSCAVISIVVRVREEGVRARNGRFLVFFERNPVVFYLPVFLLGVAVFWLQCLCLCACAVEFPVLICSLLRAWDLVGSIVFVFSYSRGYFSN